MWFGDYILSEFGHMSLFLKKIGVGLYSPTPKIIEPLKHNRRHIVVGFLWICYNENVQYAILYPLRNPERAWTACSF